MYNEYVKRGAKKSSDSDYEKPEVDFYEYLSWNQYTDKQFLPCDREIITTWV